jgi:DNA end-binding protein Ku
VVLSSRERAIAIQPRGLGLQGATLRYPYEVRSEREYFDDIEPVDLPTDMIDIARHIVKTMQTDFDPAQLTDRERAAVLGLIKDKQRSLPTPSSVAAKPKLSHDNIVNLMDALKQSLAASKSSPTRKSKRARAGH